MDKEFKEQLLDIVQNNSEELIQEWISYFDSDDKDDEHRHYDDFLGFFEECVESDLEVNSDEFNALKYFLIKLKDIIGEDNFFHFKESVYTCFLKFPIFKLMQKRALFNFKNVVPITEFFEAMTSSLIIEVLSKNRDFQEASLKELSEREAPISEIWDDILMVSIVGTLDSHRVLNIIDKVLEKLEKSEYSDVIVDINSIFDVNSEVANQLIKLNNAIHFIGATPHITGVTASIAKSLTHLDIHLGDVKTYSTTKQAMREILGDAR